MTISLSLTNRKSDFIGRPRVVIITGPGFQDHDCIYCGYRCREEHWQVDFATAAGKQVNGRFGAPVPLDKTSGSNVSFDDLHVDRYDVVILTGGYEAPDRVRQDARVKAFVKAMADAGKIVAGLCHGPWIMISARIMAGRRAAAYPGLLDDMESAGATVVDADVVVDGNLVTCRYYGEVGLFMQTVIGLVDGRLGATEMAA